MTLLEPDFLFSQHNLGDFVECPRRFYLRYVARQAWPLVETGPDGLDPLQYQAYLRRGAILHRWIERYWLGIPAGAQAAGGRDEEELALWWSRFLSTDFTGLPAERYPELALVAALGDHRLYARFDLLAVTPSSPIPRAGGSAGGIGIGAEAEAEARAAVIVDWKTLRSENPPGRRWMRRRLQTRIYLFVLATAGAAYNDGRPPEPEQCQMRYWLANFPDQRWVTIDYTGAEYEADRRELLGLVQDIAGRDREADYPLTGDERHCTYCAYRTLCRRRGAPGAELPEEESEGADLESAPELEY